MSEIGEKIKLTQYSHGAGCGCKISPMLLEKILHSNYAMPDNDRLIVGNSSKDDAAVLDLGNGMALISTTDFFMPIVDDPFQFGRIASANAISDVYAMGGKPVLAIAILGWPINVLGPDIAQQVIEGARSICAEAGISLAGGHSIDSPEPIFGLAVNGLVPVGSIKQNNTAKEGDLLFLTKPLGVGILTTAEKKDILNPAHETLAADQMMQLNRVGEAMGMLTGVNAMTDVTGFGLLGHLIEMAEGSGLTAEINMNKIPLITPDILDYISLNAIPGGTNRNWASYGSRVDLGSHGDVEKFILADPQTSGGLLISIDPSSIGELTKILNHHNLGNFTEPIGKIISQKEKPVYVK